MTYVDLSQFMLEDSGSGVTDQKKRGDETRDAGREVEKKGLDALGQRRTRRENNSARGLNGSSSLGQGRSEIHGQVAAKRSTNRRRE